MVVEEVKNNHCDCYIENGCYIEKGWNNLDKVMAFVGLMIYVSLLCYIFLEVEDIYAFLICLHISIV